MALKQIGFVELIAAIQKRIEQETGLKCYDAVPLNAESPFYFVEGISKRPDNTKTFFRDLFTIWIHCISEEGESHVGVYELIRGVDEAMTIDIDLPEEYWLMQQTNTGVQNIFDEETGEKHAVCSFEFKVSYGFRTKV